MYNHVANRGRKALLKQIFSVFLIFTLYFNTFNSAFAGAAEKWTIEEVVYNNVGKNLQYTAQKNFGPAANDFKYRVTVPVTGSALGSTALSMVKYGLASALITGLIEGVGWIIDNGVVKKPVVVPNDPVIQYYWTLTGSFNINPPDQKCSSTYKFRTDSDVLAAINDCAAKALYRNVSCSPTSPASYTCKAIPYGWGDTQFAPIPAPQRVANPSYDPTYSPKYVPVTPDEMAKEIFNSPQAPQIIPEVYSPNNPVPRPAPAPDATEDLLNNAQPLPKDQPIGDVNNKPNKDTNGDGKPDAYDPNLPSQGSEFKLPPFCTIAPTMCEWYAKYKEDSKNNDAHRVKEITFWAKVTDFFDWSKQNDSLQNEEPEQPQEMELPQFEADAFKATAGCPADIPIHVSIGSGGTATISYEPICQFAEKWSFVAPLIGFLSGAMILIGVGRKGEDGEI